MTLKDDAIIEASKGLALHTLSLSDDNLPMRPGYGKEGKNITVKTNYFRMSVDSKKTILRYHVDVKSDKQGKAGGPEMIGLRMRRRAFALLFETPEFQSLGSGLATDFTQIIITTRKLDLGATGRKSYSIIYSEIEDSIPRRKAIIFTFTLSFEGLVPLSELLSELESTLPTANDSTAKAETIQTLNIIIARTPSRDSSIYQAGQNKFFRYPTSPQEYINLTRGLIAVRGYFSSVRTSTMRTLLNINAQCSPFYPAINMWNLMDNHSRWQEREWEALETYIAKLRVKTHYLKNTDGTIDDRVKTIVGLSHRYVERINPTTSQVQRYGNAKGNHGNSQQITFQCDEISNSPITVAKYFYDSKVRQGFDG